MKVSSSALTRRQFLAQSGTAAGGGWMATKWPAFLAMASVACARRDEALPLKNFNGAESAALFAVAEQIIPTDDTPGATDAGVAWFIDAAVESMEDEDLATLRAGLAELDQAAGRSFSELSFDQQTEILRSKQGTSFFGMMHAMTLFGMFAMPARNANRDEVGWQLIGFEDRHAWVPPFGFYDGEAAAGTEDDRGG